MNKHHRYILIYILIFIFQLNEAIAEDSFLHSFIQLALEHNPDLKSKRLSLVNEETNLDKAKKEEFYPEIGISLVMGKTTWIKNKEGEQKQKEKSSVDLSSSISRPHIFGGKIKLNLKTTQILRATTRDKWELSLESEEPISTYQRQNIKNPLYDEQLQLKIANLNLTERINEIIYNVVNSYCDLQRIDSSINIKQKELDDLQANLEIAKLKLEKGLISGMDVLQMELRCSSVLTQLESLKKDKKAKLAKFYQLLGTETTIGVELDNRFLDIKRLQTFFHFSKEEHLVNIPQIKIKYIQIELAKRKLKEAEAKSYPLLIPSFNIRKQGKTIEKSVMASLRFPLYDKGIKKEEIKLALNELAKQRIELDKLIKDIVIEITTIVDEIKDKERRISVLEKEIELAKKIYEIAKIRHERGFIPAKDLLDYQSDVFQKQKTVFEEQINMFLDYVKLFKITGELYHAYQKNIF